MSRKKTNPQIDRFKLIDNIISTEDHPSFDFILETLRKLLKNNKFSEPSLRRDLKYMRETLKAPIVYHQEKNGYYYSAPFNFPTNSLEEEEIILLGIIQKLIGKYSDSNPIYREASQLIGKLYPSTQNIPLLGRIVVARGPIPVFDEGTLNALLQALRQNKVVNFVYRSFWEPNQSFRTVMPCQIVLDNGQVFLYAADEKNYKHIRLYDIHKIYELKILNRTFKLPPNYRFVEDFEKGRFGAFQDDESYNFKIEFRGREAIKRIYKYIWADDQVIEKHPIEDRIVLSFSSSQWVPIQQWLMSFGADATPLEPDWLVDYWKETINRMFENIKKN